MFGDIGIGKYKFCDCKNPVLIDDADIYKILISKKVISGEEKYKYFTDYRDDDYKTKKFYIILP